MSLESFRCLAIFYDERELRLRSDAQEWDIRGFRDGDTASAIRTAAKLPAVVSIADIYSRLKLKKSRSDYVAETEVADRSQFSICVWSTSPACWVTRRPA